MAKKKKQTVGYKYFASGHFVLCHGPIDAITKISFQDKDAYLAEEKTNKTIYIKKPSLFGGDEQQGGIQGTIELLFGRANQQKSNTLQRICSRISNSYGGLISAYRGVCSVVFDNMYIGTSPSMPDSKWRVKRIHTRHDGQVQWYDSKSEIGTGSVADINPAHIIRECLTNSIWGIGVSELSVDDTSFESAADTLHSEDMGMSIKWSDSTSINEFVANIKEHINAQLYLDRVTNKWKLYLIRDDYDVSSLISLDESNIRNLDFERRTLAECVNAVTVTYYDRERAKDSTVTVQDIARIAQQDGVISQAIDYRGFTNSDIASRIALRDLKTLSSTLASVSFDVDESFSESWHEGMAFKISDESYGLSNAVMRVRSIKRGDGINNTVHVEAIEDSFGSQMQSVVEYVPPITSADSTALDAKAIAFEVPYIELVEQYGQDVIDAKLLSYPELGYAAMAAIRPNNQHINANLYVDAGAGYDERTNLDFCPSATLKTEIGYINSSFELQNVAEFELLEVNHRLQIDNELVAFVSLDALTNTLTVKRGCFDTVPQKHEAGATIFGWDNYSGIDGAEYLSGEILSLKALTLTGSDELGLNEATEHTLEVVGRAILPYPPSNFKVNSQYFPEVVIGPISLSWVSRNRLQQTGGSPLGFQDGAVAPEDGTTYSVYAYNDATNELRYSVTDVVELSHTIGVTDLLGAATVRIEVFAVRDGYSSYQALIHIMAWSSGDNLMTLEDGYTPDAGNSIQLQFTE